MAYCTQNDYRDAYPGRELGDLLSGKDRDPQAVFDSALERATADINMYLGGRYSLPLAETPVLIKGYAVDLTRRYLHGDVDEKHPARLRALEVVKGLTSISVGTASLPSNDAGAVQTGADLVQISEGRNDFSDRGKW